MNTTTREKSEFYAKFMMPNGGVYPGFNLNFWVGLVLVTCVARKFYFYLNFTRQMKVHYYCSNPYVNIKGFSPFFPSS